jgi:hypothetical protein
MGLCLSALIIIARSFDVRVKRYYQRDWTVFISTRLGKLRFGHTYMRKIINVKLMGF